MQGVPQTGKKLPKLIIMVVDDDTAILEAMELAISLTENESICFSDSLKAIEAFENKPEKFQGIFTDLRMPNLTGEGLIQRVRKKYKDIPIVMVTASHGIFNTTDLINLNILALIAKPFELSDIELAVKEMQEHYLAISP